jgi:hypothetical protein
MATFVHLTRSHDAGRIRRSGIRASRTRSGTKGVYAMAVTPDAMVTFQWARELGRGPHPLAAVQFRIPDDEPVLMGQYAEDHVTTTASEAIGAIMAAGTAPGFEVLIPRAIAAKEIMHVRAAPKLGWRYLPDNHGRPSMATCSCPCCRIRGQPNEARLRRSLVDRQRPRPGQEIAERIRALEAAISIAAELREDPSVRDLWRQLLATYDEAKTEADALVAAQAIVDAWFARRWVRGGDADRALRRLAERWEERGGAFLKLSFEARLNLVWFGPDDDVPGEVRQLEALLADVEAAASATGRAELRELAEEIVESIVDLEDPDEE